MKQLYPRSITFRLTLFFAVVSGSVLLLLSLLVGSLVEDHFAELDSMQLDAKLHAIANLLGEVQSPDDVASLPQRHGETLAGDHGIDMQIRGPDGAVWFASNSDEFPTHLFLDGARGPTRAQVLRTRDGRGRRVVAAAIRTALPGEQDARVAVSLDLSHHEKFMKSFHAALWPVVGAAALTCGLLGWAAARQGLSPLRRISDDAARVTATHLDRRLAAESFPIELEEVARTLNDMLARLEASFKRLSDFSSDLAHELRTPVSNLMTQTQVTLSRPRTAAEYQDILASNSEEFERLSHTISDMLFLAKADHELLVPSRAQIDLGAEIESLFEFFEPVADEGGVTLSSTGHAVVSGDRLMLRRAIGNLLSNAVRHTPQCGHVSVQLDDSDPAAVTVAVANTGEPIPAEHLGRIFDRFWRADASRRRFSEGAGLGLSITRAIARAHGGDVSARSAGGMNTFEIRLGRASPASGVE